MKRDRDPGERDAVDVILGQWARERPDLDVAPMGVIGRISRLSRLFEEEIQAVFVDHGLHRGEFDVLATLRRAGAPHRLNAGELSATLMVSTGGMTSRLDRLEKAGLVAREPDPDDRRGTLVRLTEEGLRVVDAAVTEHVANEHRLLAGVTPAERDELARLLRRVLLSLDRPGRRSR